MRGIISLSLAALLVFAASASAQDASGMNKDVAAATAEYKIGVDDILDISILKPETLLVTVTVTPDGSVVFPYIGTVQAKDLTLSQVQEDIQARLADGYMKYPVVSVSLRETRSKKFFVYGEVMRPGTYVLDEKSTVLKAITMAGGFTKYGSSSRVKVLREKNNLPGYESFKVDLKGIMEGTAQQDMVLQAGDIVVVSEGVF